MHNASSSLERWWTTWAKPVQLHNHGKLKTRTNGTSASDVVLGWRSKEDSTLLQQTGGWAWNDFTLPYGNAVPSGTKLKFRRFDFLRRLYTNLGCKVCNDNKLPCLRRSTQPDWNDCWPGTLVYGQTSTLLDTMAPGTDLTSNGSLQALHIYC